MSWIALFGGLESGLIYAIVALGVYISFRVLDFPDLTADGSFPFRGCGVCRVFGRRLESLACDGACDGCRGGSRYDYRLVTRVA